MNVKVQSAVDAGTVQIILDSGWAQKFDLRGANVETISDIIAEILDGAGLTVERYHAPQAGQTTNEA
jgi:hypothetical protein